MEKDTKKQALNRLRRVEGQIRGLQKMIEDEKYCIDVITQTSAVRSALSSLEDELLKSHLSTCVVEQVRGGKSKKMLDEILKVYKLKRK